MPARTWVIVGYDGTRKFYERRLPVGLLSEPQVVAVLKRLAARHLVEDEIISASLRRNALGCRNDLEVRRNSGGTFALMTIGNPHYIARIDESGITSRAKSNAEKEIRPRVTLGTKREDFLAYLDGAGDEPPADGDRMD